MSRGKHRVDALNFENGGRIVDLHEGLWPYRDSPQLEVEARFTNKPSGRPVLDNVVQPFGPSARLENMQIGNSKYDQRVERAFYDRDLNATQAVRGLYRNGVLISKIQKAFSVGAFGVDKKRRFVPTRWSITAVDDILGKGLLSNTKYYPTINEWRVYDWDQLDNRWSILLMPLSWRYELIEAWYPNTAWNPMGRQIRSYHHMSSMKVERSTPRSGVVIMLPDLRINELLMAERRQAGAVIFREAHPGYIMPVGVWNVRENC